MTVIHGYTGGALRSFSGLSLPVAALAAVLGLSAVGCGKVNQLKGAKAYKAANAAYATQDYKKAADLYQETVNADPDYPDFSPAYFFLGNSLDNLWKPSKKGDPANDKLLEDAVKAYQVAADKLVAGDIDAAFIITGWDSPVVQQLMDAKGIALASIPRADAYIAHYPFLNKLVLPAGVSDLLNNRPPADIMMLAPKASLAVRADLHPAIQHLLLTAAQQIHSQPGIFHKAGQFPAAESIDLPLSDEAQRFYKRGLPFLQKYLPFWVATLVERMLVVLLPLAAVLYPMFRFLPPIYDWAMQSKIRRLYDEMRAIEKEMELQEENNVDAIDAKLEDLGQRANRLSLPTAYASMVYTLRSHINLVRGRLVSGAHKSPR